METRYRFRNGDILSVSYDTQLRIDEDIAFRTVTNENGEKQIVIAIDLETGLTTNEHINANSNVDTSLVKLNKMRAEAGLKKLTRKQWEANKSKSRLQQKIANEEKEIEKGYYSWRKLDKEKLDQLEDGDIIANENYYRFALFQKQNGKWVCLEDDEDWNFTEKDVLENPADFVRIKTKTRLEYERVREEEQKFMSSQEYNEMLSLVHSKIGTTQQPRNYNGTIVIEGNAYGSNVESHRAGVGNEDYEDEWTHYNLSVKAMKQFAPIKEKIEKAYNVKVELEDTNGVDTEYADSVSFNITIKTDKAKAIREIRKEIG